jgi:hypothetical protein
MQSVIFGTAFEVPTDDDILDHPSVRPYRTDDGRAFIGHDTLDIAHACGLPCAVLIVGGEWALAISHDDAMSGVDLTGEKFTDGRPTGYFTTFDIVAFDPGDDPYVVCAQCETVLLRDDDAFLAQYGRPIGDAS